MRNLLKTDLLRFLKSKQFLILIIIASLLSLAIPALLYLLQEGIKLASATPETSGISIFNAKDFAFAGYGFMYNISMSDSYFSMVNISFILTLILFTVLLANEFNSGTVRNKIIVGHSRRDIYLSLYITLFVFMFGVALFTSILSLSLSGILFTYDSLGRIFFEDLGNFFLGLLFAACSYLFLASIICFFLIGLGKTPLAIILSIVLAFFGLIAYSICDAIIQVLILEQSQSNFIDILTFLNCVNVYKELSLLNSFGFEPYQIIAYILNPLGLAALITLGGLLCFNKREVK